MYILTHSFIHTYTHTQGTLSWTYTVLNFAIQRIFKQAVLTGAHSTFDRVDRTIVADTVFTMQQSAPIFKQMLRMIKKPNTAMLLSFLRKIKKYLGDLHVGNSLLLPTLLDNKEMLLIIERVHDRVFRFVVVQTDPFAGLRNHAVIAAETMPEIHYRVCLVLSDVPKKNALDDVFWLTLYHMAINPKPGFHASTYLPTYLSTALTTYLPTDLPKPGDTSKFYDVLIPFLTGKPLEASLVEAEAASAQVPVARKAYEEALARVNRLSSSSSSPNSSTQSSSLLGATSDAVSHSDTLEEAEEDAEVALKRYRVALAGSGAWRAPQKANTAYVRCIHEGMYYSATASYYLSNTVAQY